jgi:hypothetical protein
MEPPLRKLKEEWDEQEQSHLDWPAKFQVTLGSLLSNVFPGYAQTIKPGTLARRTKMTLDGFKMIRDRLDSDTQDDETYQQKLRAIRGKKQNGMDDSSTEEATETELPGMQGGTAPVVTEIQGSNSDNEQGTQQVAERAEQYYNAWRDGDEDEVEAQSLEAIMRQYSDHLQEPAARLEARDLNLLFDGIQQHWEERISGTSVSTQYYGAFALQDTGSDRSRSPQWIHQQSQNVRNGRGGHLATKADTEWELGSPHSLNLRRLSNDTPPVALQDLLSQFGIIASSSSSSSRSQTFEHILHNIQERNRRTMAEGRGYPRWP